MYLHLSACCECADLPPSFMPYLLQLPSVTTVSIMSVKKKACQELSDIKQKETNERRGEEESLPTDHFERCKMQRWKILLSPRMS